MSKRGLACAIDIYTKALQHQVRTAEAFYFGRIQEGMEGLLQLPEEVRLKIDQLIWDASGGEAIDPSEERSGQVIAAAIMHSVEERMGLI